MSPTVTNDAFSIDWSTNRAAIWRAYSQRLKAIRAIDAVQLDDLHGLERQKYLFISNLKQFINGQATNNALLWGSRGTGKSSLVKAAFNALCPLEASESGKPKSDKQAISSTLRIIQIDKANLEILPELSDSLRELEYHFILFIDDLAFGAGDDSYQPLKTILEGNLEAPADNIIVVATSNRRHLVTELQADNQNTTIVDAELHYSDAVEEKIALSDRFGLWLSFHPVRLQEYFDLVSQLFANTGQTTDEHTLHNAARLYAMHRGSHSPRIAQQFIKTYLAKLSGTTL